MGKGENFVQISSDLSCFELTDKSKNAVNDIPQKTQVIENVSTIVM